MPQYYSDYDARSVYSVPPFTRVRHAYRSPRNSETFNLEYNQFRYSVAKLHKQQKDYRLSFVQKATDLTEGVNLEGLENLASRLASLKQRVSTIEKD